MKSDWRSFFRALISEYVRSKMCTKNVGFEFEIWLEEIFHVQPWPFLRDVYNGSCIPLLFSTMEFILKIYNICI